jgi:hypothetical protein
VSNVYWTSTPAPVKPYQSDGGFCPTIDICISRTGLLIELPGTSCCRKCQPWRTPSTSVTRRRQSSWSMENKVCKDAFSRVGAVEHLVLGSSHQTHHAARVVSCIDLVARYEA